MTEKEDSSLPSLCEWVGVASFGKAGFGAVTLFSICGWSVIRYWLPFAVLGGSNS